MSQVPRTQRRGGFAQLLLFITLGFVKGIDSLLVSAAQAGAGVGSEGYRFLKAWEGCEGEVRWGGA